MNGKTGSLLPSIRLALKSVVNGNQMDKAEWAAARQDFLFRKATHIKD